MLLELELDADGSVNAVAVREISPAIPGPRSEEELAAIRESLEELARAHAAGLHFEPARIGGTAVPVIIGFRLDIPPALEPVDREPSTAAPDVSDPPDNDADDPREPPVRSTESARGQPSERRAAGGSERGSFGAGGSERGSFGAVGSARAPVAERPPVAASELDLEVGELQRVPRTSAQSMLSLAPGVFLTQHATEGHALGMFVRGFDAAEGEDLEVLVDGMPINEVSNAHGHGYVDPLLVIPRVVDSLRVVQGPFDPSQGDFATAGTVEYRLGVREPGLHLSLGYGRFDELRLASWWRPASASEGTFAAVAFNQGDGFGPNRSFRNGTAMGRWEGATDDRRVRYSLMAFAATGTWRTAGVVRADDVELGRLSACGPSRDEQFFCFYDPNQGGSSSQAGLVARLGHHRPREVLETTVFLRRRTLRITENFTGFRTDPRTDGGIQRGDNLDQRYDASTMGARSRYRIARMWLGFAQRLEAGVQLRYDDADTRADRRRDARTVPYRTEFDRRVRETLVGAYLRADLRFTEWLSLVAGIRVDHFGFDVEDRAFPGMDEVGARLERTSFSASGLAASPRGTLRLQMLQGFDLVLSAGLGARSSDAAALSEAELAPFARVTALEAGVVYERERGPTRPWFGEVRASAFTTRVSRDLVFDATAGRNSLLGPSARSGVLAQARLRHRRHLDVLGSLTYTRSHLQPDGSGVFDLFDGPRLPFIPGWVGRLDAAGHLPVSVRDHELDLSAALGVQFVGRRPLPLEEIASAFTLVDVALGARWRAVEVGVAVRNVFDARYRSAELNYISNFRAAELPPSMMATRHFSAGAPRTFLVTLALHLDLSSPERADRTDTRP